MSCCYNISHHIHIRTCTYVCAYVPRGSTSRSMMPSFFAFSARTFLPVRAMSSAPGSPIYIVTYMYMYMQCFGRGEGGVPWDFPIRDQYSEYKIGFLIWSAILFVLPVSMNLIPFVHLNVFCPMIWLAILEKCTENGQWPPVILYSEFPPKI